jgi:hypothetical protein
MLTYTVLTGNFRTVAIRQRDAHQPFYEVTSVDD